MKIFKKISGVIKKYSSSDKNNKMGENLVILIIVGVIIIIAGGTFFNNKGKNQESTNIKQPEDMQSIQSIAAVDEKSELEKKVEEILSEITGTGKVSVMITYVSGKEIVPYYDTKRNDNSTDEKDSTGGTRKQTQVSSESNIAFEEVSGGVNKPIIIKEMYPQVKGVVVVAQGASDVAVKESLINAVRVLMDVPIHRIQVFEKKKN